MNWADWTWSIAGIGLAAAAGGVVLWAVLGDWWAGGRARRRGEVRRRCGRCLYDLRGLVGLRCPECGWTGRNERALARSRVRWRGVQAAGAMLAVAWVAWAMPEARSEGWSRLVPTAVVVCLPMDVGAFAKGNAKDWAGRELDAREVHQGTDWLSERVLTWRIARAWRAERPDWAVEVVEVPFIPISVSRWSWERRFTAWFGAGGSPMSGYLPHGERFADEMEGICESRLGIRGVYGLPDVRVRVVGSRMVVGGSPDLTAFVSKCSRAVDQADLHDVVREIDDVTVVGLGELRERSRIANYDQYFFSHTCHLVQESITRHGWSSNGGERAMAFGFWDTVLVLVGDPRMQERASELIEAIRRVSLGENRVVLPPFANEPGGDAPAEHLAVLDVWNMLAKHGAMTAEEYAAWVREDPENRDPERIWERIRAEGRAAHPVDHGTINGRAAEMIRERLVSTLAWRDDEDDFAMYGNLFEGDEPIVRVWFVGRAMVVWTTKPGLIERVEEALWRMERTVEVGVE